MHAAKVFKHAIKEGLITKKGEIQDFKAIFTYLDKELEERKQHKVLSHADSAKGIAFEPVAHAIIHNDDITIGINPGKANVIKIDNHNFGFPFGHGIKRPQNFGFVIFFNIEDLEDDHGNKVVKHGYSKEYLESLMAASPQMAREFRQNNVVRVQGKLPAKKVIYIGFRYRDPESGEFAIKLYKI